MRLTLHFVKDASAQEGRMALYTTVGSTLPKTVYTNMQLSDEIADRLSKCFVIPLGMRARIRRVQVHTDAPNGAEVILKVYRVVTDENDTGIEILRVPVTSPGTVEVNMEGYAIGPSPGTMALEARWYLYSADDTARNVTCTLELELEEA